MKTMTLIRKPILTVRLFTGRKMLALAVRFRSRTPFCFGIGDHYTARELREYLEANYHGCH